MTATENAGRVVPSLAGAVVLGRPGRGYLIEVWYDGIPSRALLAGSILAVWPLTPDHRHHYHAEGS